MLELINTNHAYIIAIIIGYFFGSIPFGLIITKMAGQGDVRDIGSGNIGATNVLRTGSKKLAAATLLADVAKGAIPVLIMLYLVNKLGVNIIYVYTAGFFAFIGHLFPVWLKFKGGKGVATYLGVILAGVPLAALAFVIVWGVTAYISRYSSLAALVGSLAVTILLNFIAFEWAVLSAIITFIIFVKHHENIKRLFTGSESKIGDKS